MSLDMGNSYATPVDCTNAPIYYNRYYPSPQHEYYGGGVWGGDCSPASSGRSVSPCDEYQPPLVSSATAGNDYPVHLHLAQGQMQGQGQGPLGVGVPPVRQVKRRSTANKKERRRTQSINTAFASLREHIPGIPGDTKLSKIKTLKHAIAYINHLMEMLAGDKISIDTARSAFRADLQQVVARRSAARHHLHSLHPHDLTQDDFSAGCPQMENLELVEMSRKNKGRTGWPQHVWVHNELKQ
ncbi:Hypothetical predicted protein [Cloeon dipterum]|uniref:BHLH domain-containing protein n=1 Tax=Cloeon dipterum TaxID=197152 RepID=A0A8S1D8Z5_9INSE|nr:Hypothetical predicted protein [Cloeon dipterum]